MTITLTTIIDLLKQYEWLVLCIGLGLCYFIYTRITRSAKSDTTPGSTTNAPVYQGTIVPGAIAPTAGTGDNAAITAAISAAVSEYRKQN